MQGDRHDKVAALIQEFAAKFIQQEANADPLITITRVNTSPDYKNATIFFTTIPEGREQDAGIFLHRSASELRHFIKKKTNLKIIPHLEFMVDAGERHRQDIDKLVAETGTKSTFEGLEEKE